MKRRDFFASSALIGASIPLGVTPLMTSCSGNENKRKNKTSYTPEQLGMPSFAKQAPDGKPLRAGLKDGSRFAAYCILMKISCPRIHSLKSGSSKFS